MNYNTDELRIKQRGFESLYFLTKHTLQYDLLTDKVHKPLCDFIQYGKGRLIDLEPRDTFKTTCGSIGFCIFMIINFPNIRILLNHKVLGKSREIMNVIANHFQYNEKFKYLYGDWVGFPWGSKGITVSKRTDKTIREPTITPGGVDHEITSSHYDLIINDDLAGLKDMYSVAEREKVLRYYKALVYLRDKGSFIKELNIGTRWHTHDIANYVMGLQGVDIRVRRALIEENNRLISYFPERYTAEGLLAERDEDPVMFATQRMNQPTAMEDQLYIADELSYFVMESFNPEYNVGYIDPAFGRTESNDPCFMSFPIGSIAGDKIHIIDWPTNKKKPEYNERLIISKIVEYEIKELGIESNAAQSEFIRNIQKELKSQGIVLNIKPINNTVNKDRRIQGMHGTVKNNVLFRDDWDKAYPEPMNQLLLYPQHKFKDAPDALAGLCGMATGRKSEPRARVL